MVRLSQRLLRRPQIGCPLLLLLVALCHCLLSDGLCAAVEADSSVLAGSENIAAARRILEDVADGVIATSDAAGLLQVPLCGRQVVDSGEAHAAADLEDAYDYECESSSAREELRQCRREVQTLEAAHGKFRRTVTEGGQRSQVAQLEAQVAQLVAANSDLKLRLMSQERQVTDAANALKVTQERTLHGQSTLAECEAQVAELQQEGISCEEQCDAKCDSRVGQTVEDEAALCEQRLMRDRGNIVDRMALAVCKGLSVGVLLAALVVGPCCRFCCLPKSHDGLPANMSPPVACVAHSLVDTRNCLATRCVSSADAALKPCYVHGPSSWRKHCCCLRRHASSQAASA